MRSEFFFQLPNYLLAGIVLLLITLFFWLGYRLKKKEVAKNPEKAEGKMAAVRNSTLGIMSLLMGFTFSVAVLKFEQQRQLTVDEANNISTSILRCDVYPDSIGNLLRADYKEYIETRIAYYEAGTDNDKIKQELQKAAEISGRIWKRIATISRDPQYTLRSQQVIVNLNNMINNVTSREAARLSRVPALILWVLLILVLTSSFILGNDYYGKDKNKIPVIGFAIIMTLTLNLITELNRPRRGLINLDTVEQKMVELREVIK